jgi:hypothetical protein
MMHFMKVVDRQTLWLNLALLLAVVFIPFPAALLGQHPTEPLAVILYGTLMLVNMTGTNFWLYAKGRPHLRARGVSPSFARLVARVHPAPILVYGMAIVLAPWWVYATSRSSWPFRRSSSSRTRCSIAGSPRRRRLRAGKGAAERQGAPPAARETRQAPPCFQLSSVPEALPTALRR